MRPVSGTPDAPPSCERHGGFRPHDARTATAATQPDRGEGKPSGRRHEERALATRAEWIAYDSDPQELSRERIPAADGRNSVVPKPVRAELATEASEAESDGRRR